MKCNEWVRKRIRKYEKTSEVYYYLGLEYFYGWNKTKDEERATQYYIQGAEIGCAKCQYAMAILERADPEKSKELFVNAFPRLLEQAKNGDSESQRMVSCYFLTDSRGVSKNLEEAFKWLVKSAEQKNAVALFNLAGCYIEGMCVEKDIQRGKKLLQKSADAGYEKAQSFLIRMGS